MKLEFHPEAELELIEAAAYYELRVPGLGERFEAVGRVIAGADCYRLTYGDLAEALSAIGELLDACPADLPPPC